MLARPSERSKTEANVFVTEKVLLEGKLITVGFDSCYSPSSGRTGPLVVIFVLILQVTPYPSAQSTARGDSACLALWIVRGTLRIGKWPATDWPDEVGSPR